MRDFTPTSLLDMPFARSEDRQAAQEIEYCAYLEAEECKRASRHPTKDPLANFWKRVKVNVSDDCWTWNGAKTIMGYGKLFFKGKLIAAHRLSYMVANGFSDITGKVILHLCDNPSCVNPKHLKAGTQADNMRDMVSKGRSSEQKKTHCKSGHPFNAENTRIENVSGRMVRRCRACASISGAKYYAKRQAEKKVCEERDALPTSAIQAARDARPSHPLSRANVQRANLSTEIERRRASSAR